MGFPLLAANKRRWGTVGLDTCQSRHPRHISRDRDRARAGRSDLGGPALAAAPVGPDARRGDPRTLTTLTRGPIVAVIVAALGLLVVGKKWLLVTFAVGSTVLTLAAFWPSIQASKLYHERAAVSETLTSTGGHPGLVASARDEAARVRLGIRLLRSREEHLQSTLTQRSTDRFLLNNTSHNSYLTILVELGAFGLLLYALPFLVITARAIARTRATAGRDAWIVAGSIASLVVIVLSASTLDFRFFSIATMLPWLFLAILQRGAVEHAYRPPGTIVGQWPRRRRDATAGSDPVLDAGRRRS